GGGGYSMLQGARVVYDRGESIRDLLAAEIRIRARLIAQSVYAPSWSLGPAAARAPVRQAFTPSAVVVARPDSTLLRVLAINDFHGALEPQVWPWSAGRPVGGAAALKPWLDSLARGCFCTTIRLDAGDEMQGTPVSNFNFGRPAIAALNAFGIDAAARLRRRRASGAPRAAAGAGRGRLRHRPGARGCVLRRRRRGDAPRPRRLPR